MFWASAGVAVVIIALAVGYRIAMGADCGAASRDLAVSLRLGAQELEAGMRLLREENERIKKESADFEQNRKETRAQLEVHCPTAILPPIGSYKPPIAGLVTNERLQAILDHAQAARDAASRIEQLGAKQP